MDKKKIGEFLKSLRQEKGLSQSKMVNEFSKFLGLYDVISEVSISKWERGEVFPDINNIKDLSSFFNVTIDEIFNGERKETINYEEKYFICKRDWYLQYYENKKEKAWEENNRQRILVENNFKKLLFKIVDNTITTNEEKEFDFLCERFYFLRDDLNIEEVKFKIRKEILLMHNSTKQEKYWEAYKFFDYKEKLDFFRDLCDNVFDGGAEIIGERIKSSPDFQKDILLAFVQKNNVTHRYGKTNVFYKKFGVEYDEEKLTKDVIKLLIKNGAKLNYNLMGRYVTRRNKIKIIDVLERMYKDYKKPILLFKRESADDNKNYYFPSNNSYYFIENNYKNRLLQKEYMESDKDLEFNEVLYNELEEKLYNGEEEYVSELVSWDGIEDFESEEFVSCRNEILKDCLFDIRMNINEQAYKDYYKCREEKKTKELLKDLNLLTLSQIREKYFTVEPILDEKVY